MFTRKRQGAAVVEFAITFPILILFLFGFFEIAHALMIDSVVENAAYEGVRRGIVPGATVESVERAATDIAIASSLKSVDVIIEPNAIGPDTEHLTVTVSAPLRTNGLLIGTFLGDATLTRSATMIREPNLRFRLKPESFVDLPPLPRQRRRRNR